MIHLSISAHEVVLFKLPVLGSDSPEGLKEAPAYNAMAAPVK
jgi:hypothetical protein